MADIRESRGSGSTGSQFATNAQTATYQVLAGDFSAYKTIPVASGTFTITLVASGSQPATGQFITVINYGTGTVTIARSGQNINGGTGSILLYPASATQPRSAKIISDGTNYFAELRVPNGVVASVDSTGLTANVASATLFTPATKGQYRMFINIGLSTPATTSSTVPTFNIAWTGGDGTNPALTQSNMTSTTLTQNTEVSAYDQTNYILLSKAGSAITYSTSGYASAGATAMQYGLHVVLEQLTP